MKRVLEIAGVFVALFFAVLGAVLAIRGLEIVKEPLAINPAAILYHLDLEDAFEFYAGCVLAAASLTFLRMQRQIK